MGGVVDKGFISTRAGTKAKAIEVALLYIEVENDGSGVVVSFDFRSGEPFERVRC